jgi:ribose transport system substrate-binding protein
MTQGAIDAFVEAGRPLVPMSGEAGNGYFRTWLKYMGVDQFESIAPCYTTTISVTALETLIRALNGEKVAFDEQLPIETYYSEDVRRLYRPDLPDSFWCDTQLTDDNLHRLFDSIDS